VSFAFRRAKRSMRTKIQYPSHGDVAFSNRVCGFFLWPLGLIVGFMEAIKEVSKILSLRVILQSQNDKQSRL